MPIIHQCADSDCGILTMGDFCANHETELSLSLTPLPLGNLEDHGDSLEVDVPASPLTLDT